MFLPVIEDFDLIDTLSVVKYHRMKPQQALWETPQPSLNLHMKYLKQFDSVGNQTSLFYCSFHAWAPEKQIALFLVVAYPISYYG